MLKHQAAWGRWLAGMAAVVLALTIVWALFVPAADWLAHNDVGSAKGPLLQTARDAARGRLLTVGAGLIAVGALWFTARTFALSREGQVTDRYTKAITQLGDEKLDVRIGGIYALERVARDSAKDHPTVMEVLTAFIREHSHEQVPPSGPGGLEPPRPAPRADIQAAAAVIGRRDKRRDMRQIDLRGTNLRDFNLATADLSGADLRDADLRGADLTGADLKGADLRDADLDGPAVTDADLATAANRGASVRRVGGADLTNANLSGADLRGASLARANLSGADLTRADITHADLTFADLSGAHLIGTHFTFADLTFVHLRDAWWPADVPAPWHWQRDPDSGRLKPEATDSGPGQAG